MKTKNYSQNRCNKLSVVSVQKVHSFVEYVRLHDIKNDIVDRLKSDEKPCKYIFELYLENIKECTVYL
jgi:hypothetical protein